MIHRPSALPMVALCPKFRGNGGEHADAGTARHKALYKLLAPDLAEYELRVAERLGILCGTAEPTPEQRKMANDEATAAVERIALQDLPQEDQESVKWAADYVRLKAPMSDYPLACEVTRKWLRPNFEIASGTPDVVCGPVICDLKSRYRDYTAQMADYALSVLQTGHEKVTVHLLFTSTQKVEVMEFDRERAEGIVYDILAAAASDGAPKLNDYCGWCAEAFKCPVHLQPAAEVAKGYTADPRVQSWHPSKMETGEELAYALWIWRTQLSKWGESIEHHAREAAIHGGKTLCCKVAEYELKTRAGKKYCTDVAKAFSLAGVPQSDFMACCDLRIETSKKYPDKKGIANTYGGQNGMKLAPAKREILTKLETVIKQAPETISLVAKKAESDNEESE